MILETHTLYAFISVFIVSLISLIGIFALSVKDSIIKRSVAFLIALAIGALLGDAFIHLLPEALEGADHPELISLFIIGGIVLFFIFEKLIGWHHHHHQQPEDCEDCVPFIKPIGRLVLVSDSLHNIIDGIIIGISYLISIEIGIATTLAIMLHEIPQEIGDFGILLHAGYSKAKALWFNFLSALFAVLGVMLALFFGQRLEVFIPYVIALAAGNFIYLATADLVPELHKEHGLKQSAFQIIFVLIGIAAMYGIIFIE